MVRRQGGQASPAAHRPQRLISPRSPPSAPRRLWRWCALTDLRPLRDKAERVLKQVRPTEVLITSIDVAVDRAKKPPEAVANLVVRVTGNVIDKNTPGTALVGVKILLHNKDGQWRVKDAEAEQVRPGQGK